MATIKDLPAEMINMIVCNNISIQDFGNFFSTCNHFHEMLNDQFWKQKCYLRWPDMKEICENQMRSNALNFKELTKARVRYCKELQRFLTRLNEKHFLTISFYKGQDYQEFCRNFDTNFYSNTNVNVDDEELDSLLYENGLTYTLNYHFLINELENLIEQSESEHKELTNIYYSKKLLPYSRHYHLKNDVWQVFINKPVQNQLFEEAVTFFAQWCQPEKTISYSHTEKELDNIMIKVKAYLKAEYPMHPIFSASDEQLSFWKYNELDENQWNISDGKIILDILCTFFSSRLIFHGIVCPENETSFRAEYVYINHILERKVGCAMLIALIFQSIARRFGVRCDFIFSRTCFLIWKSEYNIINPDNVQDFIIYFSHDGAQILSKNDYFRMDPNARYMHGNLNTHTRINSVQLILELIRHLLFISNRDVKVENRWIWELTNLIEPNDMYTIHQLCIIYILQKMNPSTFITAWQAIWIFYCAMPHICCASRCFNTSYQGYALVRFPKEDNYRKAWLDAAWGENVSKCSLENLRLCEMPHNNTTLSLLYNVQDLVDTMQENKQQMSIFYEEKSRPKRRKTIMNFAVGMIVRMDEEIGVIIGWEVIEFNYSFNNYPDPCIWFYTVVCKNNIIFEHVTEDSLQKMDTPRPIDNSELGKYFREFTGTYYMPNERLKKEYPDDELYVINNL